MTWSDLTKPWHDTNVDYCDVCGNLLINRYWVFVGDEPQRELRCCDERCERLFFRLSEFDQKYGDPPWTT